MANRYDRDPDEYGFGRRDVSRDSDDPRQGSAQGPGYRAGERNERSQGGWREGRGERDRPEGDYRGAGSRGGELRGLEQRGQEHGGPGYRGGREGWGGEGYGEPQRGGYSEGREDWGDRGRYERDRYNSSDRFAQGDRQRNERPGYRGYYQEQVWTRDPSSGNVYGYEYSTRVDPRRFNTGDESGDRWRSNVNEQNRRFDIDRGWTGSGGQSSGGYGTSGYGTSGYGNTTRGQSHFGKGPKGYTRSDERIREDVCDRLSDDDEVDASDITVTVKAGEVILEGTVSDRRSKHRAEDIAESVSGVKDVTNHLRARKGLLQEIGDKLSGSDDAEHHGHSGSGTRNSTSGTPQRTAH